MSDLKKAVQDLIQDLSSNEVAILEKDNVNSQTAKFISYGKVELEGDSIHVMAPNSQHHAELHNELLNSSNRNRKSVWNFIRRSLL